VGGRTIIERILSVLKPLFKDIVIVTNSPHLYQRFKVKVITDVVKGKGPLGGIYSGLLYSDFPYSMCVACDMPFLDGKLIAYMKEEIKDEDMLIPRSKVGRQPFTFGKLRASDVDTTSPSMLGLHPLHAIYSKRCIPFIEELLNHNKLKISELLSMVRVRYLYQKEIERFDSQEIAFYNINNEEDLKKAEEIDCLIMANQ